MGNGVGVEGEKGRDPAVFITLRVRRHLFYEAASCRRCVFSEAPFEQKLFGLFLTYPDPLLPTHH